MPDKKGSDDRAYARGFAAGRAAATPDPPDDWTAAILTLRRAMCTPAGREQVERELIRPFAASPDERLREAGERLAQAVARVCGEGHPALGMWRVALAAADREKPDEDQT